MSPPVRVLVTGALGNVGLYSIDALRAEGHEVVAFDLASRRGRRAARPIEQRVQVVWGDLTDAASLDAGLEGVDAVVHLAAIIPPHVAKAPEIARRVNVGGTCNLIARMQASKTARRLVFASSTAVFGNLQDREPPLRRETPLSPTDDYGRHKVACEQEIRKSTLAWSILRLGVAVPTRLLGAPHDLRTGFAISADARFEFVHPADAATAFARAVGCAETIGKTLFIGGGEKCQMRYERFFNALMSAIGIGPIPNEAFIRAAVPHFMGDWLDTEESQRLLRYQERGLGELTADLRRDLGAIAPLVRLLGPLVTWFLLRSASYSTENRNPPSS